MAVVKFTVILCVLLLYCNSGQCDSVSILEELPVHYANYGSKLHGGASSLLPLEVLEGKYFQQQAVIIEQISQIVERQEQLEKSFNEKVVLLETVVAMRLEKFQEAIIERIESLIGSQDWSKEAFHDTLKQYESSIESKLQKFNEQIVEKYGQLKHSMAEVLVNLPKINENMFSMDQKLSLMTKKMATVDHRSASNEQIFEGSGDDNAEISVIGSELIASETHAEDIIFSEPGYLVQNFLVQISEDTAGSEENFSTDISDISEEEAYPVYRSCLEVPKNESGLHWLKPFDDDEPFQGYCEQDQHQGGWLVFQHRFNGSVEFYRDWADYKAGFGQPDGEFWLGLEKLHRLTTARKYTLMVELKKYDGDYRHAYYDHFEIGSETEQYALKELGYYSGTAGDSLALHKGMSFSTNDRDNDAKPWNNCAFEYYGAWWYEKRLQSNLNGLYMRGYSPSSMCWVGMGGYLGLQMTRMMIREA